MNVQWSSKRAFLALLIAILLILLLYLVPWPINEVFSPPSDKHVLSPAELPPELQTWISSNPAVSLCTDNEFPPIEFTNEQGEYAGIAADFLTLIEQKTGLQIVPVQSGSFSQCIDSLKKNQTDLIGAVFISDLRDEYLIYTEPYLQPPLVFLVKKSFDRDLTIDTIREERLKVAVVYGYTSHELLKQHFPDIETITVDNVQSGLYLTSVGSADVFFGDLATSTYYVEKSGITNLHIAGMYTDSIIRNQMAFGVNKNKPEIARILDFGLSHITPEERDQIMKRWISPSLEPPHDLYQVLHLLSITIAIAAGIILIFLLWTYLLKVKVKEQTRILLQDIEEKKTIEEALLSSERKYRTIFENSSSPLMITDDDGTIILVNKEFLKVTGFSEEEMRDLVSWKNLIPYLADQKKFDEYQIGQSECPEKNPDPVELHLVTREGVIRNILLTAARIPETSQMVISFIDSTERNQARDVQRLATLINFIPDAVFAINTQGVVIAWNRSTEEMTGIPASKIIGTSNYEYSIPFYGERKPILIDLVSASAEKLQDHHYSGIEKKGMFLIAESRNAKPKGIPRILKGFAAPLFDENGIVVGAIEGIHDVTDVTLAHEALQESEERYRTIVEYSPVIIFSLDTGNEEKIIRSINPAFEAITGWTVQEWIGRPVKEIMHPDDYSLVHVQGRPVITGNQYVFTGVRIVSRSGDFREGNYIRIPILRSGHIQGELGFFLDLTEQRRAEDELRSSEAELKALFSSMVDIVIVLDFEGRYLEIAPTNPENLYKPAEELIGKTLYDIFPEKAADYMSNITRSLEIKQPVHFEYSLQIQERQVWFSAIISPMTSHSVILVARDISELKRSEEAIMIANKKLNLLSKITRHDIINLLAGLSGYLNLSLELVTDETAIDYIKKAEKASESILRQIDFTREYQDVGIYKPEWQNIGEIIDALVQETIPSGISCIHEVSDIEVYADPLLNKVFYTLLENSIRHGERVSEIHISRLEKEGTLSLIYEDNGVGIEVSEKEKIFERGFGKHTGFGLFLTKEILSITGLSIRETGKKGVGARFEIMVQKGSFRYLK